MKALRHSDDDNVKKTLTLCGYFRVFPLSRTKNGYYRCHLRYDLKNGKDKCLEWFIPADFLEENGHFELNNDYYFARWLLVFNYGFFKDEKGIEKEGQFFKLSKMIDFWNVRIFGECQSFPI